MRGLGSLRTHTCSLGSVHANVHSFRSLHTHTHTHTHTQSLGPLHTDTQLEVTACTHAQFGVNACTRALWGHCTHTRTVWGPCMQMCSLKSLHTQMCSSGSLQAHVQFQVIAHTQFGIIVSRCAVWGHFMHTCTAGVIAHTHAKCESLHSHMHSLGSLHTRAVFGGHCIHTDVHFGGHCTPTRTAVLHTPRAARAIPNLLHMHTLQHGQCMQTAACSAGCLLHDVHAAVHTARQ